MSVEYRYLKPTGVTPSELERILGAYSGNTPPACPTIEEVENRYPNLHLLSERHSGRIPVPDSTILGVKCTFCTIQAALAEQRLELVISPRKDLPGNQTSLQDKARRLHARHIATFMPTDCSHEHLRPPYLIENRFFLYGVGEFVLCLYRQGQLVDLRVEQEPRSGPLSSVIKAVLPGLPAFLDKVRGGHRSSGLGTGRSYPEG